MSKTNTAKKTPKIAAKPELKPVLQFTPQTAIAACCDVSSTRYVLGSIQVIPSLTDESIVYAAATDAKCMAVVKVPGQATVAGLIPGEAVKTSSVSEKTAFRTTEDEVLTNDWITTVPATRTKAAVKTIHSTPEGRFPNCASILPVLTKAKNTGRYCIGNNERQLIVFRLNPNLLTKLKKALTQPDGKSKYAAEEYDSKGLLFIAPTSTKEGYLTIDDSVMVVGEEGIGVVMPMSEGNDDWFQQYSEAQQDYTESHSIYVQK